MNDFEHRLQQMIPVIRDREPQPTVRVHSFANIALGFVLGAFATYYCMQPIDTPQRPERQATYKWVLDDTNLQQLRRPIDVRHLVVRVPTNDHRAPIVRSGILPHDNPDLTVGALLTTYLSNN